MEVEQKVIAGPLASNTTLKIYCNLSFKYLSIVNKARAGFPGAENHSKIESLSNLSILLLITKVAFKNSQNPN